MKDRAREAEEAARLRSEVAAALQLIEMLKSSGLKAVQEVREEAEREANVANMLRRQLDDQKESARQTLDAVNAEVSATAERRYKEGVAQGESQSLINRRADSVRVIELERELQRQEVLVEQLRRKAACDGNLQREEADREIRDLREELKKRDSAFATMNERMKRSREEDIEPVSYTHLTLPTTPYV